MIQLFEINNIIFNYVLLVVIIL